MLTDTVESPLLDIGAVEKITSLADISRLLQETLARERGLEAELDQLLNRRGDVEQSLLALHASSRDVSALSLYPIIDQAVRSRFTAPCLLQTLEVIHAEAESLAGSVQQTSSISERVSKKVRELDTAQSRINGTLESIDYIINRTNAVDGVQEALQMQDYETAAAHVGSLLQSEDKHGAAHDNGSLAQSTQQSKVSCCADD